MRLALTVTVNKAEVKLVLEKLDNVKLELLRLRAMLLPDEEVSEEEKKKIDAARKEIAKGKKISLDDLLKELCWLGLVWDNSIAASGKAIVSTIKAAEGLDLENEADCLMSKYVDSEFTNLVLRAIED